MFDMNEKMNARIDKLEKNLDEQKMINEAMLDELNKYEEHIQVVARKERKLMLYSGAMVLVSYIGGIAMWRKLRKIQKNK